MTKTALLHSAAHAERIDSTGRKPTRTEEPGRICQRDGCNKLLSVHNRGKTCFACTPEKRAPLRLT